jgi:benzoyl-CoA-dihydrodiol lyase
VWKWRFNKGKSMTAFHQPPSSFRHWNIELEGSIATLQLQVDSNAPAFGTYELKLNSYDIGVDIELANAIRYIRFENPEIKCVVITSALDGTFCAGANIRMLAAADHSHKINFCKFTNETRLEMEEASQHSGIRFLAAINGACSGGGYELALACDHILLIDDRRTAVSLPEVPLLGVLPGTGGLTRLTDKRHVRRDRADVFATRVEGALGEEALRWGLVDELAEPSNFADAVSARAHSLAAKTNRIEGTPVDLPPLDIEVSNHRIAYRWVDVKLFDQYAKLKISADKDSAWMLQTAREFDDALCRLRFDFPQIGTLILQTEGRVEDLLGHDAQFHSPADHQQHETALLWKRCLSRLDLTSKTLVAAIEPGSCFVGVLFELALAADRTYMLDGYFEDDETPLPPAIIRLTATNFGAMPMANDLSRLTSRLWGDEETLTRVAELKNRDLVASQALEAGLVTITPDDLDWADELRLFVEERCSFSSDALTAMETNHRFCGPETIATKIFGRLSAWQNWIFARPNASGPNGALQRYGTGSRPHFDNHRT